MKNKKIIFIIAIVAFIGGVLLFYQYGTSAVSSHDEEVIVRIESGSTVSQILDTLDDAGLIKNKFCAQIFLKFNHYDNLQANAYKLNKNMSLSTLFGIIENPDISYIVKYNLTIKEGNTLPEVAEAFSELLKKPKEDILKEWADKDYLRELGKEYWFIDESLLNDELLYPLEGYLYPDTYYVTAANPTLKSVTKMSLDMMDKNLTPLKSDIEKTGWTTHQFLSFASVVERESGQGETDRPMIAGVFMNRLQAGMLLQSDITVNYAWQRTGIDVNYSHLEIDSPYNTYKYKGLPVGPISTIPIGTLKDSLYYTKHDYLYFFAQKDPKNLSQTTIIYTKTYADHLKAIKKAKDAGLWLSS